MTVGELKEKYAGQYADVEVYADRWNRKPGFHTDRIMNVEDYEDLDEVVEYSLMDEGEYSSTVFANCSECTDFERWFGDKDAKILVAKVNGK